MALLMPILVSLFLGGWQFGYSYFIYNELEQAVRAGARYASTRTYDSATPTPSAAFQTAVANVVVYGDPAGGTTPVAPGLTPANVGVTGEFVNGAPRSVTVRISNYPLPGIFSAITLNKPVTQFPFLGIFGPP